MADVPWYSFVLNLVVMLVAAFLILLVLIQRGKGGGLSGAFGGAGGSSPFGSRAGDTFTRITIVVAAVWLFLIGIQVLVVQGRGGSNKAESGDTLSNLPGNPELPQSPGPR
jgi:preprotein translocase subunit SecG